MNRDLKNALGLQNWFCANRRVKVSQTTLTADKIYKKKTSEKREIFKKENQVIKENFLIIWPTENYQKILSKKVCYNNGYKNYLCEGSC